MKQVFERGMEKGGNRAPVPEEFREGGKPFKLADRFANLSGESQGFILGKLESERYEGMKPEELLGVTESLIFEAEKLVSRKKDMPQAEQVSAYRKEEGVAGLQSVSPEMEDVEENIESIAEKKSRPKQEEILDRFLKAISKTSGKHPAKKPKYKDINRNVGKRGAPWLDSDQPEELPRV